MKGNTLKKKLAAGRPTVGSWITLAHPAIAEIMAKSGFDWLAVDLEHSVITLREAEELIRVIDLCGVTPLVRLTSNDPNQIKRVMDAGAHGVIVPSVNNPADAQKAVAAVHYPPQGRRGVGLARAQGYGVGFDAYRKWLKDNAVVIAMIEHWEGVKHVRDILSTEGVDGYFIGPYDLSTSLGIPGQFEHPHIKAAMNAIKKAGQALKKPGGLHIVEPDPAQLKRRLREGFQFLAYSLDTRMIDTACRAGLKGIKKG